MLCKLLLLACAGVLASGLSWTPGSTGTSLGTSHPLSALTFPCVTASLRVAMLCVMSVCLVCVVALPLLVTTLPVLLLLVASRRSMAAMACFPGRMNCGPLLHANRGFPEGCPWASLAMCIVSLAFLLHLNFHGVPDEAIFIFDR